MNLGVRQYGLSQIMQAFLSSTHLRVGDSADANADADDSDGADHSRRDAVAQQQELQ